MAATSIGPGALPERAYGPATGASVARVIEDENNNALFGATAGLVKTRKGAKTTNAQITVTTTPTQLLAANTARITATLTVKSGTGSYCYFGPTNGVSASTAGIWCGTGQQLADGDSSDAWYAVADSGSFTVGVVEVS